MVKIDSEILPKYGDKAKMILQIHDELLFEVKDEIINDFKIVATAAFYKLEIVYSEDNKTMISKALIFN